MDENTLENSIKYLLSKFNVFSGIRKIKNYKVKILSFIEDCTNCLEFRTNGARSYFNQFGTIGVGSLRLNI